MDPGAAARHRPNLTAVFDRGGSSGWRRRAGWERGGAALVGEIIHVTLGPEREWERTRVQWSEGLAAVGALFGDDESLMRAKADRVYQVLRRIVEEVPPIRVSATLPDDLPADHLSHVTTAMRDAALKGIEAGTCHAARVLAAAIYDLCTSKLRDKPS